jgi:hypothetical protein
MCLLFKSALHHKLAFNPTIQTELQSKIKFKY